MRYKTFKGSYSDIWPTHWYCVLSKNSGALKLILLIADRESDDDHSTGIGCVPFSGKPIWCGVSKPTIMVFLDISRYLGLFWWVDFVDVMVFGCVFFFVKSNPLTRLISRGCSSQRDISTIWNGTEVLFSRFTFIDGFSVPKWWDGHLTTSRAKPRTLQVGIYLSASLDWWTPTLGTITTDDWLICCFPGSHF